jgi:hypothetical protein
MAAFVFGVIEAPVRGWTDVFVWGFIAAGLALAAAFTVIELRHRFPLLDVRLFSRPDFATGAVGVTFLFFANFGFFFVVMQYIQLVMGYSPLQTALALSPLVVPIVVFSVTSRWYLPRLGLGVTVSAGLFIVAAGLVSMRALDAGSSYLDLTWLLLIASTGVGLCTAPATSAIMSAVPDEKQGVASAVNDATREVGAALGIAVAGSMLAAQYTKTLTPALAQFPEQVRNSAIGSLAEALAVSGRIGPEGPRLAELARSAFLDAMDASLLVLAIAIAVAAVFVAAWSPGRDGRQVRVVRRLRLRRRARAVARYRT